MTDQTTRYPLPDDPAADPLAAAEVEAPPPTPPAPPATGWEPPRHDENRWPAVVFGLIMIVVGLWFFAETTLGIDLPTIRWGQLWPLIIIGVGILILWGARVGRR